MKPQNLQITLDYWINGGGAYVNSFPKTIDPQLLFTVYTVYTAHEIYAHNL